MDADSRSQTKILRTTRACQQCRRRKQRCDGPVIGNPSLPCQRCKDHGARCSFEDDIIGPEDRRKLSDGQLVNNLLDTLRQLQDQLSDQGDRIRILEGKTSYKRRRLNSHGDSDSEADRFENDNHQMSMKNNSSNQFSMETVNLEPPIKTLRNLTVHPSSSSMIYNPVLPAINKQGTISSHIDPISRDLLDIETAQILFDIFFDNCHHLAPVVCNITQNIARNVRSTSPLLFLSICAIGARYWNDGGYPPQYQLHTQYFELIKLLDKGISRLLLRPSLNDVNLDTIRVLLLYAQWMPLDTKSVFSVDSPISDPFPPHKICETRYSDISAWSVLGLAIRYALFLGLDQAVLPFESVISGRIDSSTISDESLSRIRIWVNLLSCDYNLMLTSGLPASTDPEPAATIARCFFTHPKAKMPQDVRIAGLCELVAILRRAAKMSGDPSARTLDYPTLEILNKDLDIWEENWISVLASCGRYKHNQIPFTTLRGTKQHFSDETLTTLKISVRSAAHTIFALAKEAAQEPQYLQNKSLESLKSVPFTFDSDATTPFRFAVDSYWVTNTFSMVFLVLCYSRGFINLSLEPSTDDAIAQEPLNEFESSSILPPLLIRLGRLIVEVFDTVCATSAGAHPGMRYQKIIHNAYEVISSKEPLVTPNLDGADFFSIVDLFNDTSNSNAEWHGSFLRELMGTPL